ncbi:MAG: amidohydrolase family protein [Sphingomonas sp.]
MPLSPQPQRQVSKRAFMGLAGAGSLALASAARARAGEAALEFKPDYKPMAGTLDLSGLDIVDTHMHPLTRSLISQSYARQAAEFGDLAVPAGDYPEHDALQADARAGGRELVWGAPRRTGYFNYIARNYGVPATMAGFDSVTSKHIGSDADFTRYIRSVLDRERISTVVLQAAEPAPAPPATLIPADRYVWTTVASDMARLSWAKAQGLTELADVLAAIDRTMETAVANGCRGFKNASAYYRPFGLTRPGKAQAAAAFKLLQGAQPSGTTVRDQLYYDDPAAAAAQTAYEDYLFKYIYIKAGKLERPVIIHTAVALHPSLRTDFNDPRPLYGVFVDPDVQKAQTKFLLIHAGYPAHHVVGAFISQFANVFVDVSFFSKYPGALLDIYRTLLSLGPSEKIMHGSDSNTVPEELGYCAWNTRAVLAKVLTEYRDSFGWTQADIGAMAENILHKNARKLFGIG